jgi:hypothetical protein
MKEAMWKADLRGEFQFSDYTDSSKQSNLFPDEPDYPRLRELIVNHYSGKRVSIDELGDWVVSETPFRRTHFKRQILASMEVEGVLIVTSPKAGRKKGTFGDGTVLQFA